MPYRKSYRKKTMRKRPGRVAAARTIVRAMKNFTRKKRQVRRYKAITGGSYNVVKVRMHRSLQKQHLKVDGDDSMYFNIFFAPWRNLNPDPTTDTTAPNHGFANLFYHPDFKAVLDNQQYAYMRLKGVYMEIRRPKAFMNFNTIVTNTDQVDDTTNPWCSQVLHTFRINKANTQSTVLEPSIDMDYKEEVRWPSSWNECVDNGKKTKLHHYNKYAKRIWLPFNQCEKRWLATANCELDHSIGGLHLRHKYSIPVGTTSAVYERAQNIFDITATVYMEFRGRT